MINELNEKELRDYIDKYLTILDNNFSSSYGKKIENDDLFTIYCDLSSLFNEYFNKNQVEASKLALKRYIPLMDIVIKIDRNTKHQLEYEKQVKNAYRISARTDLECYFIYREWEEKKEDKFFEPRYEAIRGYIHYLQEIVTNPKFRLLIFNAMSGFGKLIADYIPVLTRNGWKNHGDLKVGDEVISPNGEFVKVTLVHPKRFADTRITFADGEQIDCHNQHEWQVYDRLARKYKQVEAKYMLDKFKMSNGQNRFLLPKRNVVIGETKKLPVDPYTYGVWLGDGTTKQGRITENVDDFEIFNHIPYTISNVYNGTSNKVKSYHLKGLVNDLHKLGLCYQNHNKQKFIHDIYLTSDINQRLELMAGLIDSDGYLDKKKQRYIISTINPILRDNIITLAYSFGWRCSVTEIEPRKSSSGILGKHKIYSIGFSPDIYVPCKLKRKQLTNPRSQRMIGIEKLELIIPTIGNCITVEGGLYLVGKTLKMTHNTYPEKISEAWAFGYDPTKTVLSLCSNDDVVKGGSRTVIDEIKSEWFGEVFPNMKYDKDDKNFFLKETDSMWKLRDCKLNASYYANTVQSNVVGIRASQRIHIDDLYADYKEAMVQTLNEYYLNKYLTVWSKRFVQNEIPKVVVTGTLWASGDFINLLIGIQKKKYKFYKHPKYKYTYVNKDESVVIIQIPALDYETGLSTCPELKTTQELLEEKANIDEYLWETNFQQKPTDPDSLFFSWNKLRTYDKMPITEYTSGYAVIDATRKTGKDFFAMPIFVKVPNGNEFDYYFKDCLFTRTATKDMYDDVCNKIIEHHIVELVIESNVTSELKQNIEKILNANGIFYCQIREKYQCENKQARIQDQKGNIVKKLVFPNKNLFGVNSDIGKFMENLTLYNDNGRNPNDDACFEAGTLISTQFGDIPIEKIEVGMKVITPYGLRKVVDCGITGKTHTINKLGLNATPNHKVFNVNKSKFMPIDTFTSVEDSSMLSLGELIKWKQKLWYLMGKLTKETQSVDITSNTQREIVKGKIARSYIEQCGNITMGKSQKGIKYIIKMVILIITTFLTWSVYHLGNICHTMLKKIGTIKNLGKKCTQTVLLTKRNKKKQKIGIGQKKVENGIENTQKTQYVKPNLEKKENVNFVEKNTLQRQHLVNIVVQNVNKKHAIIGKSTNARYVERNLEQQLIIQKLAQENVKTVYNMKVEGAGCYYANHKLVSNCDSSALFTKEFVEGGNKLPKIKVIQRPF